MPLVLFMYASHNVITQPWNTETFARNTLMKILSQHFKQNMLQIIGGHSNIMSWGLNAENSTAIFDENARGLLK